MNQKDNLDLQKEKSDLEKKLVINDMSGNVACLGRQDGSKIGKSRPSSIVEPTKAEILSITTKIHSFDKPVFITLPGCKVFTIFGKTPILRIPEVTTESIEMHVINDDELGYSTPQYNSEEKDFGISFDDKGSIPLQRFSIFVVCGKKFGTRKLDALASILLKLNAPQIIVQKYSYNKNNKSAQWVPEYNKKITKLEHHIHKFLRNNG